MEKMYDKNSFLKELRELPKYWDAVDAVMEELC